MPDAARFAGRVALVTGGASGLGLATARRLGDEGARVAIVDLPAARPADAASHLGSSALGLEADVTDAAQVDAAVARVEVALGPIDALVTSAGISRVGSVLDTTPEDFERVLAVNLTGTFVVVQAVARRMVARRRGRIVLLGSITGSRVWNDRAAYAASKGGVIALAKACAVDLAPYGIAVNSVSPGPVATPQTADLHGPTIRRAVESAVPMARYGEPDEIAAAIAWLLCDDSRFVSGHDLVVDGALTAAAIRYDRVRADRERGTPNEASSGAGCRGGTREARARIRRQGRARRRRLRRTSARRSRAGSRGTARGSSSPAATRRRPPRLARALAADGATRARARVRRALAPTSIRVAVELAAERHGVPDLLVNSLGVQNEQPMLEVTEEAFDEIIDVNLKAAMFLGAGGRARCRSRAGAAAATCTSCRCARSSACAAAAIRPTARARAGSRCWSSSTRPSSRRTASP